MPVGYAAVKTTVIITHRVPGFHYYPQAEGQVSYLANRHRHLFFLVVAWVVTHDNRDVEFHTAQEWLKRAFPDPQDFGPKSCEMIAKMLHEQLLAAGHPAPSWIEVWEDQECGARVDFTKLASLDEKPLGLY